MKKEYKTKPSKIAKIRKENGVFMSYDSSGRNIMFNERCGEWIRVDELVWEYFGDEERNGRNIIHIDGNIRNDAIFNLRLED